MRRILGHKFEKFVISCSQDFVKNTHIDQKGPNLLRFVCRDPRSILWTSPEI